MDADLKAKFIDIVGAEHALLATADMAPYLVEMRGLYRGKAAMILRPESVAQVSQLLQLAHETYTPVVPQGGNTGLVGGQQPDTSGKAIIISLARLNKIREIDLQGNLITVEAGTVLQTLQEQARQAGRLFPLSLGAQGSCQIGGNLSTNAGGTAVLAYGNTRELCLGLEVVLPDGRILNDLRYVKKDNSGYDLKDLFIGAEGTLGIITAAVMKLFPLPKGRAVAYIGINDLHKVGTLFNQALNIAGNDLTAFELIGRNGMDMTLKHVKGARDPLQNKYPWYVLIELSSNVDGQQAQQNLYQLLEQALAAEIIEDAALAQSEAQAQAFWKMREDMSLAQRPEGGSIKHDISVPVAQIPHFIEEAETVIEEMLPGARIVCFGHFGDGNLHYNISQPVGADKQQFLSHWHDVNHRIHALVMRYRGAFSAEHGIGQLKRGDMQLFKSPVALDLMRAIKQQFDPHNIMNPDKVL